LAARPAAAKAAIAATAVAKSNAVCFFVVSFRGVEWELAGCDRILVACRNGCKEFPPRPTAPPKGHVYAVEKPTKKLDSLLDMDSDALLAEVKKIRGKKRPLTAAALQNLREEYSRSIEPARALAVEALGLENEISCLVNEAYGLTPEQIALMWETAPPRMPIPKPV